MKKGVKRHETVTTVQTNYKGDAQIPFLIKCWSYGSGKNRLTNGSK